jgi:hypothetical protein
LRERSEPGRAVGASTPGVSGAASLSTFWQLLGGRLCQRAFGPGTRLPALVISPFLRGNFVVDHTQYDTTSILATIERRFDLAPLSSRDAASTTCRVCSRQSNSPEDESVRPAAGVRVARLQAAGVP